MGVVSVPFRGGTGSGFVFKVGFPLGTTFSPGFQILIFVPELSGQTRDVISHADGPRRCRPEPVAINSCILRAVRIADRARGEINPDERGSRLPRSWGTHRAPAGPCASRLWTLVRAPVAAVEAPVALIHAGRGSTHWLAPALRNRVQLDPDFVRVKPRFFLISALRPTTACRSGWTRSQRSFANSS